MQSETKPFELTLRDAYMTAKWLSYKADDPSFSNISAKSWDEKPTYSLRCGWTLSVQATCQFWSGDVFLLFPHKKKSKFIG